MIQGAGMQPDSSWMTTPGFFQGVSKQRATETFSYKSGEESEINNFDISALVGAEFVIPRWRTFIIGSKSSESRALRILAPLCIAPFPFVFPFPVCAYGQIEKLVES